MVSFESVAGGTMDIYIFVIKNVKDGDRVVLYNCYPEYILCAIYLFLLVVKFI